MQNNCDDIYMQYANMIKRFLVSITNDYDLAEDLTQEVHDIASDGIQAYILYEERENPENGTIINGFKIAGLSENILTTTFAIGELKSTKYLTTWET